MHGHSAMLSGASTMEAVCNTKIGSETRAQSVNSQQSWMQRLNESKHIQLMIWLVVLCGITLRTSQLATNRSLFLDEAFVATNINEKSFGDLFKTLEFDQRAPAGFLVAVKMCWNAFGHDDWVLRLVPFLSGVLTLLMLRILVSRLLEPLFQLFAITLFALAVPQIFYSSELKQYTTDSFITVAMLTLAMKKEDFSGSWRSAILAGVFGACSFFFSFVAVFVLGAVGIVLLGKRLRERQVPLVRLFSTFAIWGVGFVLVYFLQIRNFDPDPGWKWMWGDAFLEAPLFSIAGLEWLFSRFVHVATVPAGLAPIGLASLFFAFGAVRLARTNLIQFSLLISPILAVLFASIVGAYPFGGRVILFTAPSITILVAFGLQEQARFRHEILLVAIALPFALLLDVNSTFYVVLSIALVVVVWAYILRWDWLLPQSTVAIIRTSLIFIALVLPPIKSAVKHFDGFNSYNNPLFFGYRLQEIKPLMQFVRDNREPGDKIYLYNMTDVAFSFYAQRFGFKENDWKKGVNVGIDLLTEETIARDLSTFSGESRVWLLFTHVPQYAHGSDLDSYVAYLDRVGTRKAELVLGKHFDAAAYLYDLSSTKNDITMK